MADVFVGQLFLLPFNFAPFHFALCQGQLLPISQNTALFSLLGTFYGGNGTSNFALPDLRGRIPIGQGQGPGLQLYSIGEFDGVENVTLLQSDYPSHTHAIMCSPLPANVAQVSGAVPAGSGTPQLYAAGSGGSNATLAATVISTVGGGVPHENRMPFLTLNWCIALQGIFPSRN